MTVFSHPTAAVTNADGPLVPQTRCRLTVIMTTREESYQDKRSPSRRSGRLAAYRRSPVEACISGPSAPAKLADSRCDLLGTAHPAERAERTRDAGKVPVWLSRRRWSRSARRRPASPSPDTSGTMTGRDDFTAAPALLVAFVCNHCPYVRHVETALGTLLSH